MVELRYLRDSAVLAIHVSNLSRLSAHSRVLDDREEFRCF